MTLNLADFTEEGKPVVINFRRSFTYQRSLTRSSTDDKGPVLGKDTAAVMHGQF